MGLIGLLIVDEHLYLSGVDPRTNTKKVCAHQRLDYVLKTLVNVLGSINRIGDLRDHLMRKTIFNLIMIKIFNEL